MGIMAGHIEQAAPAAISRRAFALGLISVASAPLVIRATAHAQGSSIAENLDLVGRYFQAALVMIAQTESAAASVPTTDLSPEQRAKIIDDLTALADAMDQMAGHKQRLSDRIKDYLASARSGEMATEEARKRRFQRLESTAQDLNNGLSIMRRVLRGSDHLRPADAQVLNEIIDDKESLVSTLWQEGTPSNPDQLMILDEIMRWDERLVAALRKVSTAAHGTIQELRRR